MAADTLVNLVGVLIATLAVISAGIWQLSRTEARIASRIAQTEISVQQLIAAHRIDVQALIDQDRRMLGETIAAIREKVNDVQREGLTLYVRRESFYAMLEQLKDMRTAFEDDIKERLRSIEAKFDRWIEAQAETRE